MSRFYDAWGTGLTSEWEAGGCVGSWGSRHLGPMGVGSGSGTSGEKQGAKEEQVRGEFLPARGGTQRRVQQTGSAVFLSTAIPCL